MANHCIGNLTRAVAGLALLVGVASPVRAVDGVIDINQARALAGGVTPGDGPGFPVTISAGGSYRLTGNLTVPGANTDAITVNSGGPRTTDVTLDLNGFGIYGANSCGGCPASCSASGSGAGVRASSVGHLTVTNGTIQGMGSGGIDFNGAGIHDTGLTVQRVKVISNGGDGIFSSSQGGETISDSSASFNSAMGIRISGGGGSVIHSTASGNGQDGINCDGNCNVVENIANTNCLRGISVSFGTVRGNTAIINLGFAGIRTTGSTVIGNTVANSVGHGIAADRGVVIDNAVNSNTGFGLFLTNGAGYGNNHIDSNAGGTVSGGLQIGTNVCNGSTTCP